MQTFVFPVLILGGLGLFFGLLTLAIPLAAGILTAIYVQKLDLTASLLLGEPATMLNVVGMALVVASLSLAVLAGRRPSDA